MILSDDIFLFKGFIHNKSHGSYSWKVEIKTKIKNKTVFSLCFFFVRLFTYQSECWFSIFSFFLLSCLPTDAKYSLPQVIGNKIPQQRFPELEFYYKPSLKTSFCWSFWGLYVIYFLFYFAFFATVKKNLLAVWFLQEP